MFLTWLSFFSASLSTEFLLHLSSKLKLHYKTCLVVTYNNTVGTAQTYDFCLCRFLRTRQDNKDTHYWDSSLADFGTSLRVIAIISKLLNACYHTRPLICFHPVASHMTQMVLKCVHLKEFIVVFRLSTSHPSAVWRGTCAPAGYDARAAVKPV